MIYWLLCEFFEDLNYKIKEKIKDYIFILSIRKSDINIIEYIIISGEFKFNINKIQTSRYLKSKLDIELIMGKWQSMVRERKLKELIEGY